MNDLDKYAPSRPTGSHTPKEIVAAENCQDLAPSQDGFLHLIQTCASSRTNPQAFYLVRSLLFQEFLWQ